jgi:hypothetical protein
MPAAMVILLILIWEQGVILPIMGRSSGYGKSFGKARIRPVRDLAEGNHGRAWVIDPTRLPLRCKDDFLLVRNDAVALPVTNELSRY